MKEIAIKVEEISEESEQQIVDNLETLIARVTRVLKNNATKETVTLQDGTTKDITSVKRQKLRAILSELRSIEKEVENVVYDGVLSSVELSIVATTSALSDELEKVESMDSKEVVEEPDEDNFTLSDKAAFTALTYSQLLQKKIRESINRGDALDGTIANVNEALEEKQWVLRRLVVDESFTVYRRQFVNVMEDNGLNWLRIHETFPRHPRRKSHECYFYANEDKYGKGAGVFRTTDTKIYKPHLQCTSWLEIVYDDEGGSE
ncbi:hypothetical protein [Abyssicoccus albus]|uniref:Uncharacterized protein n=1 Tax=Abyssicoccus albus TaxID=1817405 RepID=A0A3N5BAE6_9BACL|nr:hypothetical protein [Abyssicoccus albus]RPF54736.1 hypothetical protein EDD62_1696 [Abyssicoccus albus]